jgi:short-subunit dehydrogenase
MTVFLGLVATYLWENYDSNYYKKNRNKMLSPEKVAAKIVGMIFDNKHFKNGDSLKCIILDIRTNKFNTYLRTL